MLSEAGLLPGALQKNAGLKFLCETVELAGRDHVDRAHQPRPVGDVLRIPINHFEGNYVCDERDARRAAGRGPGRRPLRRQPERQPRRHRRHLQREGNVVGLMPHPERASDALLGSADGVVLLKSLLAAATARATMLV